MKFKNRKKDGFSIIEVMVSFVIIIIIVLLIVRRSQCVRYLEFREILDC